MAKHNTHLCLVCLGHPPPLTHTQPAGCPQSVAGCLLGPSWCRHSGNCTSLFLHCHLHLVYWERAQLIPEPQQGSRLPPELTAVQAVPEVPPAFPLPCVKSLWVMVPLVSQASISMTILLNMSALSLKSGQCDAPMPTKTVFDCFKMSIESSDFPMWARAWPGSSGNHWTNTLESCSDKRFFMFPSFVFKHDDRPIKQLSSTMFQVLSVFKYNDCP